MLRKASLFAWGWPEKGFDGKKCPRRHTSHYLSPPPCVLRMHLCKCVRSPCKKEKKKRKKESGSGAFSRCHSRARKVRRKEDVEALSGAECKPNERQRPPLLSPLVRKELTSKSRWGVGGWGGQTLGSMVTECVINAAMCPVPRTFSTPQDPFSDSGREGGVSRRSGRRGEGASGPPVCHYICPKRGYSLRRGPRANDPCQPWSYGRQQISLRWRMCGRRGQFAAFWFTLNTWNLSKAENLPFYNLASI